jgi:hypothetical protein
MIERQIVIGLIVSDDFLREIRPGWEPALLEAQTAKIIAPWCVEYFDEFGRAPGKTIETIYFEKLRDGEIPKNVAEDVEESLRDLSEEFDESFNFKYVLKKAKKYFRERSLLLQADRIKEQLDAGELDEAERLASTYRVVSAEISNDLDLGSAGVLAKVKSVFSELSQPIIRYPGLLGKMWNTQLLRAKFVVFSGIEKRGKSYWLLDMAMRGIRQRKKVAFFQAGDMTEVEQLERICIYLAKKPIEESECGVHYVPVIDCVRNQLDICDKEERECDFGPFSGNRWDQKSLPREITMEQLIDAYNDEKDYRPCRNCQEFTERPLGTPWVKKINIRNNLKEKEALEKIEAFFLKEQKHARLSTHPNGTLTVSLIRSTLEKWERENNFIPDAIIIDYADILVPEKTKEFRHGQDQIWRDLRGLSQAKNALVVTATQADSLAYKKYVLDLSNFSEDKRKNAHVTAMYGLNQDKEGREKQIGIMRINEIVKRKGATASVVTVIQDLKQGRPFLGSYRSK